MSEADPYAGLGFAVGPVSFALYPAGATFGPRTLSDYEFVWIVAGDVKWECDGIQHDVSPGSLTLARPKMRDAFVWDPKRPSRHGFIHFTLERAPGLPAEKSWPVVRRLGYDDIIWPLLRHLAWLQSARPIGWERHAHVTFAQVLVAFITGATGTLSEVVAGDSPIVDRVMVLIRDAWGDGPPRQLPVAPLARKIGISRGHLIRVFRECFGVGPAETQRLLRLHRAATLLARTNLQIQEVSEATAFANPFHFTRAFHAAYGCAPREFRRRCEQGMGVPVTPLAKVHKISAHLWR